MIHIDPSELPALARESDDLRAWVLRACVFYARKLAADRRRKDPRTYADRAAYRREYERRRRRGSADEQVE